LATFPPNDESAFFFWPGSDFFGWLFSLGRIRTYFFGSGPASLAGGTFPPDRDLGLCFLSSEHFGCFFFSKGVPVLSRGFFSIPQLSFFFACGYFPWSVFPEEILALFFPLLWEQLLPLFQVEKGRLAFPLGAWFLSSRGFSSEEFRIWFGDNSVAFSSPRLGCFLRGFSFFLFFRQTYLPPPGGAR